MAETVELKTGRLLLRQWREEDLEPFFAISSDPVAMEYYPAQLSRAESDALACRFQSLIADRGWGFWVVELLEERRFIGFVGLHEPTYELPVTPCVEIGWCLARAYWHQGYATEAATASLDFAFNELGLDVVYSFTSVGNHRSWAVMERLGMVNSGNNFEHPILPEGHPLREHCLYKITGDRWRSGLGAKRP